MFDLAVILVYGSVAVFQKILAILETLFAFLFGA